MVSSENIRTIIKKTLLYTQTTDKEKKKIPCEKANKQHIGIL